MLPRQRVLARNLLRRVLGDEECERLRAMTLHDAGFGYDIFGLERESSWVAYALGSFLHRHYFRVESFGIENVPSEGAAIVAPNHSGILPLDAMMIAIDIVQKTDPPRLIRTMVDYLAFRLPWVGVAMTRVGQVAGTRRNFAELMRRAELLCVFPEGAKGTGKTFWERYRLRKFNVGHVELSLRYRAPIIPTAVIGAEEQAPMLLDFKPAAKLLNLPYFPITPTFPWLGPLGVIPLPVKYFIYYGKPLRLWEEVSEADAGSPEIVISLAELVRTRVADLLELGLSRRKGVFS